jgi:cyclophilin family peptidyl-prolyl cis-trans isomerase
VRAQSCSICWLKVPLTTSRIIATAREGGYDGTTFHRAIRHGIIQGGDPLSKDPTAKEKYGTGGLNRLKPEINSQKHTRGAVSAVLVPNRPDSAGTQFFICISDQPALDGQYTVFARVVTASWSRRRSPKPRWTIAVCLSSVS